MEKFICPQVIGHRGASYYAPENTKAAIILAAKQGAKWVEVDLWLTRDKNIAIIHNSTINKRTNGTGKVLKYSFAELTKFDAGSWHSEQYAGQRILSLPQLIQLATKLDINLNLEIKANAALNAETAQITGDMIGRYWPKEKALPLVSSYSLNAIEVMQEKFPEIPRALVIGEWNRLLKHAIVDLECSSIHADRRLMTKRNLASMHDTGLPVIIHTVNGIKSAVEFIEMGVDGLFTDRPDRIIEVLQKNGLNRF